MEQADWKQVFRAHLSGLPDIHAGKLKQEHTVKCLHMPCKAFWHQQVQFHLQLYEHRISNNQVNVVIPAVAPLILFYFFPLFYFVLCWADTSCHYQYVPR